MLRLLRLLPVSFLITLFALPVGAQDVNFPEPGRWYRLITRYNGSDDRRGKCVQFCPSNSEHPDLLWSATVISPDLPEHAYQLFRFEQSPDGADKYALICKAAPSGYVSSVPTAYSPQGRWRYVETPENSAPSDKYGFTFKRSSSLSGIDPVTGYVYCAISVESPTKYSYMSVGGVQEDYAINLQYATAGYDSNEWIFSFEPHGDTSAIDDVYTDESDFDNNDCYDLYGRKVTSPSSGYYIVGGRKVLLIRM